MNTMQFSNYLKPPNDTTSGFVPTTPSNMFSQENLFVQQNTDFGSLMPADHVRPTIVGINTLDDITREVCRMVFMALSKPDIEIEAKFGTIIDKSLKARANYPVTSDALLRRGNGFHFESQVGAIHFNKLNKHMNKRIAQTQQLDRMTNQTVPTISWSREKVADFAYEGRYRITLDSSNTLVGAVQKARIEDVDILSLGNQLDWRVSAKSENKVQPIWENGLPVPHKGAQWTSVRRKDRITYKFSVWRLDMSLVDTQKASSSTSTRTYEIELECTDTDRLRHERALMLQGKPSYFIPMISAMIDNVKSLNAVMSAVATTG